MKILAAIDGSKEAGIALEAAARLLRPAERHFDLLSVAPKLRPASMEHAQKGAYERSAMREITRHLQKAQRRLSARDQSSLLAQFGSPAPAIAHKTGDYDLTVVGAKARGGLGPVASQVAEHSVGPVLIGREIRGEGTIQVLVAVDGSAASERAIETLCALFDLKSAEVCLIYVSETPWIEMGLEEDWVTYSEEDKQQSEAGVLETEMQREGEAIVETARAKLAPYCATVTTRMAEGTVVNEILSEAERGQCDLIVVGATGGRDLKHRMLGSVSAKLAWDASCSVLIVREAD